MGRTISPDTRFLKQSSECLKLRRGAFFLLSPLRPRIDSRRWPHVRVYFVCCFSPLELHCKLFSEYIGLFP